MVTRVDSIGRASAPFAALQSGCPGRVGENDRVLTSRLARRSPSTGVAVVAVAIAVVVSLTGCVPGVVEPTTGPSGEGPSASAGPSSSPGTPSETSAPAEKPTPLSISCSAVVSAQAMYDFNPNFGLLDSFTPAANTLAAQALADEGTVCRWMNQTSRVTIDFGLSSPGPTAFAAAKAAAQGGTAVSGLGDEAWFSVSGGVGVLQAFTGSVWITAASEYFASPQDAVTLMADAVAAVG